MSLGSEGKEVSEASVRKLHQSVEEVPNRTAQDKVSERQHCAGLTVHGAGESDGPVF